MFLPGYEQSRLGLLKAKLSGAWCLWLDGRSHSETSYHLATNDVPYDHKYPKNNFYFEFQFPALEWLARLHLLAHSLSKLVHFLLKLLLQIGAINLLIWHPAPAHIAYCHECCLPFASNVTAFSKIFRNISNPWFYPLVCSSAQRIPVVVWIFRRTQRAEANQLSTNRSNVAAFSAVATDFKAAFVDQVYDILVDTPYFLCLALNLTPVQADSY